MKEAKFYKAVQKKGVQCYLCPHNCNIQKDSVGICRVRKNIDGKLWSLIYGRPCAVNVDPIEKKPLFHFLPGSTSLSVATIGCNLKCSFCQNHHISQPSDDDIASLDDGKQTPPESIIEIAKKYNCKSISYTYTEPTIFYEYAYDISVLAKKEGIANTFVSNGFIGPEALAEIAPLMDAINIDLKFYSEDFYKKISKAKLKPVLDTILYLKNNNVWVEVTTLIVSGLNDKESELKDIAKFIKSVSSDIPWHISRFHPSYKYLEAPATSIKILHKAYEIGKEVGIKYIYTGNIPGDEAENTFCSECKKNIIERVGFHVGKIHLKQGKCEFCDAEISGVFV